MKDAKEGVGLLLLGKPEEKDDDEAGESSDYEPDEAEIAAGDRLREVLQDKGATGADVYKAIERVVSLCGMPREKKKE
jgi:hypothetical protein